MVSNGVIYISTDVYELYDDIMTVLLHDDNKEYIQNDPFWVTDYKRIGHNFQRMI